MNLADQNVHSYKPGCSVITSCVEQISFEVCLPFPIKYCCFFVIDLGVEIYLGINSRVLRPILPRNLLRSVLIPVHCIYYNSNNKTKHFFFKNHFIDIPFFYQELQKHTPKIKKKRKNPQNALGRNIHLESMRRLTAGLFVSNADATCLCAFVVLQKLECSSVFRKHANGFI